MASKLPIYYDEGIPKYKIIKIAICLVYYFKKSKKKSMERWKFHLKSTEKLHKDGQIIWDCHHVLLAQASSHIL